MRTLLLVRTSNFTYPAVESREELDHPYPSWQDLLHDHSTCMTYHFPYHSNYFCLRQTSSHFAFNVFQFLDIFHLRKLSLVCPRWPSSKNSPLNNSKPLHPNGLTSVSVHTLCPSYSHLSSVPGYSRVLGGHSPPNRPPSSRQCRHNPHSHSSYYIPLSTTLRVR